MVRDLRKAVVKVCDVLAPVAFLAAALLFFFGPLATIRFPDALPIVCHGCRLAFLPEIRVAGADQQKMIHDLFWQWKVTALATAVFALIGVLAVAIRFVGSVRGKALFEKLEIGVGAIGLLCMGMFFSDAQEVELFRQGFLVINWGVWAMAGAFAAALATSATAFFMQFTDGGEYRVGTLVYNNRSLLRVFFWLLWGDFFFVLLMYNLLPSVLPLQLKKLGIDPLTMMFLLTTMPNIIITSVTPVISYKSDRTRTRWGRRIPYIIWTTPLVAVSVVGLGYLPQIHTWIGIAGVGAVIVAFTFFGNFVNTVYWYVFADVVPEQTMGRFIGLFRLVGQLAGFIFNMFCFRYVGTHARELFVVIGLLYLVCMGLMCLKLKEGQYPPVDDQPQTTNRLLSFLLQARNYFRESFSNPLYVALFVFNMMYAVSEACASFRLFFYSETAGISWFEYGKVMGWSSFVALLLMYPAGMIVDRFKPLPTLLVTTALLIPTVLLNSFIHDFASFTLLTLLTLPVMAIFDATNTPILIQILPKDKYGQFCSANGLLRNGIAIVAPLIAAVFIASSASMMVTLKPGETLKFSADGRKWRQERCETSARQPLEILQAEAARSGADSSAVTTNFVCTVQIRKTRNMIDEGTRYYAIEAIGQDTDVVLPGVTAGRWFYLSNTSQHQESLRIKMAQWQNIWYWQSSFIVLEFVALLAVLYFWRRRRLPAV